MGNRNWMNAREGVLKSDKFKDGLEELFPILTPNCSDSATLDNAFELPVLSILLSIIFVYVLVYIIMKYSMNKINKQNIMETIRKDNI